MEIEHILNAKIIELPKNKIKDVSISENFIKCPQEIIYYEKEEEIERTNKKTLVIQIENGETYGDEDLSIGPIVFSKLPCTYNGFTHYILIIDNPFGGEYYNNKGELVSLTNTGSIPLDTTFYTENGEHYILFEIALEIEFSKEMSSTIESLHIETFDRKTHKLEEEKKEKELQLEQLDQLYDDTLDDFYKEKLQNTIEDISFKMQLLSDIKWFKTTTERQKGPQKSEGIKRAFNDLLKKIYELKKNIINNKKKIYESRLKLIPDYIIEEMNNLDSVREIEDEELTDDELTDDELTDEELKEFKLEEDGLIDELEVIEEQMKELEDLNIEEIEEIKQFITDERSAISSMKTGDNLADWLITELQILLEIPDLLLAHLSNETETETKKNIFKKLKWWRKKYHATKNTIDLFKENEDHLEDTPENKKLFKRMRARYRKYTAIPPASPEPTNPSDEPTERIEGNSFETHTIGKSRVVNVQPTLQSSFDDDGVEQIPANVPEGITEEDEIKAAKELRRKQKIKFAREQREKEKMERAQRERTQRENEAKAREVRRARELEREKEKALERKEKEDHRQELIKQNVAERLKQGEDNMRENIAQKIIKELEEIKQKWDATTPPIIETINDAINVARIPDPGEEIWESIENLYNIIKKPIEDKIGVENVEGIVNTESQLLKNIIINGLKDLSGMEEVDEDQKIKNKILQLKTPRGLEPEPNWITEEIVTREFAKYIEKYI